MKIAIEAQRIFRPKKHGMDIVALELIKHLQLIDKVNEYYILVKSDDDRNIIPETKNFHIIEVPGKTYPVWEQYYLPKVLKRLSPDILHCTSNTAPIFSPVPTILTLHDILFMKHIDFKRGTWYQRFGNLYRRLVVPNVLKKCNRIITVSEFEKREIAECLLLSENQIDVVYNSYSPIFKWISDPDELQKSRKKYNLPEKFVLYLGNTHPNKNIRNVLKAFGLLQREYKADISLVIPDIGSQFLERILHEINEPALKAKICLTGYVPNSELVYLYNAATIFLYPSFYESFGIPILESMACGTPVIASKTGAMPEVSGCGAVITDPGDPNHIKESIQGLLQDSEQYNTYQMLGLKRSTSFSWEKTANQVKKIYEEVYQNIDNKI